MIKKACLQYLFFIELSLRPKSTNHEGPQDDSHRQVQNISNKIIQSAGSKEADHGNEC